MSRDIHRRALARWWRRYPLRRPRWYLPAVGSLLTVSVGLFAWSWSYEDPPGALLRASSTVAWLVFPAIVLAMIHAYVLEYREVRDEAARAGDITPS